MTVSRLSPSPSPSSPIKTQQTPQVSVKNKGTDSGSESLAESIKEKEEEYEDNKDDTIIKLQTTETEPVSE